MRTRGDILAEQARLDARASELRRELGGGAVSRTTGGRDLPAELAAQLADINARRPQNFVTMTRGVLALVADAQSKPWQTGER